MDRAPTYLQKVLKDNDNDNDKVRAFAWERGKHCGAIRILFTPYTSSSKEARPPEVPPDGLKHALGNIRTLYLAAKDAARFETSYLRVFNTRYGFSMKYSLPRSKDSQTVQLVSKAAVLGPA